MKKIKLSQPYASMVIAGILETLPNLWNNIKYGEKIFIYAENFDEECKELDSSKSLHRKIYNEFFLGNIPGNFNEFPVNKYIGYVRVYHKGINQEDWCKDCDAILFVATPRKFKAFINDFNTDETTLENVPNIPSFLKRIKRVGNQLYVPVGKQIWQSLKNDSECRSIYMFWEKYMESFAEILFPFQNKFDKEVTDVHFKYGNNTMSFLTSSGISQNFVDNNFTLDFDLEYRNYGNTFFPLKEDTGQEETNQKQTSPKQIEQDEDNEIRREYRPFIRFISTPMGGMTKWKR